MKRCGPGQVQWKNATAGEDRIEAGGVSLRLVDALLGRGYSSDGLRCDVTHLEAAQDNR